MKLPQEAKRVFKGKIFDVYQWDQRMFDGTYETFEMLKRPNTIEVIAIKGDKILLSKQSQPNKHDYYSLFGGRAEEGEEPLATAQRELLEESGYTSNEWEFWQRYDPIHKIEWEIFIFIARNCKKMQDPTLDAGEKIETVTCSFEEFIEITTSKQFWGDYLALTFLTMTRAEKESFRKKLFTKSL
jgi:ADP-ribose pyrophosphatase